LCRRIRRSGPGIRRDLDFFVAEPFEAQELALVLDRIDRFAPTQVATGTLNGYLG